MQQVIVCASWYPLLCLTSENQRTDKVYLWLVQLTDSSGRHHKGNDPTRHGSASSIDTNGDSALASHQFNPYLNRVVVVPGPHRRWCVCADNSKRHSAV